MQHAVTDTDIIVPVREVMNEYIDVVGGIFYPTVYICDVFKNAFSRHKIARDALGPGNNAIIQQMCYMLGVSLSNEELDGLNWAWGIEGAFDSITLTKFYREGNRIVYGPDFTYGWFSSHDSSFPKDQILVRIGMMSRMIEAFGESAVFCIPLCGE